MGGGVVCLLVSMMFGYFGYWVWIPQSWSHPQGLVNFSTHIIEEQFKLNFFQYGLEPFLIHSGKSCIAQYFRQFSTNTKIQIMLDQAKKTGF